MKVKTIMTQLGKCDPEADVRLHHHTGQPVLFVLAATNIPGTVWLETEGDCDLASEIHHRLNAAGNVASAREQVYRELSEMGVTAEKVRAYHGAGAATEMEEYCHENGLPC